MERMTSQDELRGRNVRVGMYLLGWIGLLVVASLIVIWTRN